MVQIRLGAGATDIKGSVGGNTFSRNRSGAYIRSRTKPVNTRSTAHSKARARFNQLTQLWHKTLTDAQRIAWNTYAASIVTQNKLGEPVHLTGQLMFERSNMPRLTAGLSTVLDAPTELSLPGQDPTAHCTFNTTTGFINVSFDIDMDWVAEDGSCLCVYVSRPQKLTKNFCSGPWLFLDKILGNYDSPPQSPSAITLPANVAVNQKMFFKFVIVRSDGRVSNPFYYSIIVADSSIPSCFANPCKLQLTMNDNAPNTTVLDSRKYCNGEAQQNTSVLHATGKINGALSFNGSSDRVIVDALHLWTKEAANPILPAGTQFGTVWLDSGTYHFYYSDGTNVNHAYSSDGVSWTIDTPNNPVLSGAPGQWDEDIEVVNVFKDGGTWYILYRGKAADNSQAIGLATSANGIDWTKEATNPVLEGDPGEWDGESHNNMDPFGIIKIGSQYVLYYNADIPSGSRATGIATSTNLIDWTKNPYNPIFQGGYFCPDVFKYGDYYYLIICAGGYDHVTFHSLELYRDTSPTFYKADRVYLGCVIGKGDSGEWDDYYIDTPRILTTDINRNSFPDGQVFCYYTGQKQSTLQFAHGLAYFNLEDLVKYRPVKMSMPSNGYTVCFWVKWTSKKTQSLLSKSSAGPFYYMSSVWFRESGTTLRLYVGTGYSSSDYTMHTVMTTPANDVWTFVVAGWDIDTNKIFSSVDGAAVIETAITFSGQPLVHGSPINIGCDCNYADNFDGVIDDVMVFNKRLTADEIAFLYNSGAGRELIEE